MPAFSARFLAGAFVLPRVVGLVENAKSSSLTGLLIEARRMRFVPKQTAIWVQESRTTVC
ncbi:MAG: hypothetical protein R3B96_25685 [Pirellulaceae bacterium]